MLDHVLASHGEEKYTNTSPHDNCVEFNFQTDRNRNVDLRQMYLTLKLKFVKGRGYESYNTKEVKKEHKDEEKADEETEEQVEEASLPPLLM